jgi:hypothetical protein
MASEQVVTAITAIVERMISLAASDAAFREQLHVVAQHLLEATAPAPTSVDQPIPQVAEVASTRVATELHQLEVPTRVAISTTSPAIISVGADASHVPATAVLHENEPAVSELLTRLTLGQRLTPTTAPAVTYPPRFGSGNETDLSLIEARCRLKAEGCRWASTRRRLMAEGAHFATEIEPKDRDIIARAKALTDCYLWMCQASGPSPSDLKLYEDVAICFEAIAEVLAVIRTMQDNSYAYQTEFEKSLDLLAEAQSTLRVAVTRLEYMNDHDQLQVYNWLRNTAQTHQIFIRRYMRADDLGDPVRAAELITRVELIEARLQESKNKDKKRKKLLGKILYRVPRPIGPPSSKSSKNS